MSITAPDRTLEQRMDALKRANRTRSHRSAVKRDVARGKQSAADLIESSDPRLATMKVAALLLAMPTVGHSKVKRWLWEEGVSPSKTVGGLTPERRRSVAVRVRAYERLRIGRAIERSRL